MRAISTVVDATLFLLVLGVAVTTIVGVPAFAGESPETAAPVDHADAVAEHLATGTERVNYSLAPAARGLDGDPPGPIHTGPPYARSAHGTLASLLADAAVGRAAIDGVTLDREGQVYAAAVANATEARTTNRNHSVQVRAVWEPYPGAPVRGAVVAGSRPPPTVDVHAATVTVDGPVPATRDRALEAAEAGGFEAVADVVADGVVDGLFPPDRTRLAVRGSYPVDALTAERYHRARTAVGLPGGALDAAANVSDANAELSAGLSARLASDMRERFESPRAAARAVDTGTVTVTVRTWSG